MSLIKAVQGIEYDLSVLRTSSLCLVSNCILNAHCAINDNSFVISCSSGSSAHIGFDGHISKIKSAIPIHHTDQTKAKPITVVECVRRMNHDTLKVISGNQRPSTELGIHCPIIKTTTLAKGLINLAVGLSDMVAVKLTELSVMDSLLLEALNHTHDVSYTDGDDRFILIERKHKPSIGQKSEEQCQTVVKLNS